MKNIIIIIDQIMNMETFITDGIVLIVIKGVDMDMVMKVKKK